jgi:uncharacterized protein YebE (UPF0316 family)
MSILISALSIFGLRLVDVSVGTLRMLMVLRGHKVIVWFLGFIQAFVFVTVIRTVWADIDNWLNIVGYAAGFATGNVLGIWLEGRIALGFIHLRIVSKGKGEELTERLREEGYAVTTIAGRGRDGTVNMLECSVRRRVEARVEELIQEIDPEAFITAERVRSVKRGYWGR